MIVVEEAFVFAKKPEEEPAAPVAAAPAAAGAAASPLVAARKGLSQTLRPAKASEKTDVAKAEEPVKKEEKTVEKKEASNKSLLAATLRPRGSSSSNLVPDAKPVVKDDSDALQPKAKFATVRARPVSAMFKSAPLDSSDGGVLL